MIPARKGPSNGPVPEKKQENRCRGACPPREAAWPSVAERVLGGHPLMAGEMRGMQRKTKEYL
jgi:hypothetical protein